ncbi:MAG TPA: GDSL-type esterase/lipase family protein [Sunxiuqinia sp.]|nr:GDSL-type esterase/lipase family protein [Sunxiuqinia sp.]
MKSFKLIFIHLIFLGTVFTTRAVTVHTIGDSTMASYDENTTDKRGWGMMFQQFFTSDVTINNRAKSGASSKSFYEEAPYWTTVKKQIQPGDYVIIQFGHNDEKNDGLDGDTVRLTDPTADYRGTTAQGTFKTYLRAYVNETRALGATPILATPMCRKYFSGGKITRKGRHDLGGDWGVPESDHTYDYAYAIKEVAQELDVPLIDLTTLTKQQYEAYGDAYCTQLLFCNDDSTHPNAMGGTLVARLCAQDMYRQNILASYINTSTDVLINPTSCDFGDAYTGQTVNRELTITGYDLDPASGTFTLSVSDGFSIAASKDGTYASSITMDYANNNLDFTKFYINASQAVAGAKSGTLTVTNGNITKTVPLTANFIHLTGGADVKLFWELSKSADYTLDGPANPVDESWSDMYVQRYAAPNSKAVWPEESGYDASRLTQRNLLDGDVWPAGEIDEVSTRYIQFGISASEGSELNIDSIGMYVCGAGGSGMRCRISYSTNNFADYKVIQEFSSMVANNIYAVSAIPVEKLSYGDTLLVRVYPWYSGEATGKTICLADVCIHGVAANATSVLEVKKLNNITYSLANHELIFKGVKGNCVVNVFNLAGQKMMVKDFRNGSNIHVSIPSKKGLYLYQIVSPAQRKVVKYMVR